MGHGDKEVELTSVSAAANSDVTPKQQAEIDMENQIALAKMTDPQKGLSMSKIPDLQAQWGPNELPEKKVNPFLLFLSYFWGPMPVMIWIAIIIELVKAILIGEGWEDFAVLMVLQFANATVGFIEENNAGNAIAALKNALKPVCFVCRDGEWKAMPSRELVPGDLIKLKLGDVVPADSILLDKHGALEVDQAALTGESLPVTIHPWGHLKMGSSIKRGESTAVVAATGLNTFFGKAAGLIAGVQSAGHLQAVLLRITMYLLVLSVVLCAVIFAKLMSTEEDPRAISEGGGHGKVMASLSVVIVILVASIPIAIEVVCTSTLAVGSHVLAAKKVIVARLSAIEELAGMTILCSDKTGTLTQNKLSLREPILFGEMTKREAVFYSALASNMHKGAQDAIDFCITNAVDPEDQEKLAAHEQLHFEPFNPSDKRATGTIKAPDGSKFLVCKGAPHIILRMCHNKDEIKDKVNASVQELADRGFRALGVGINRAPEGEQEHWEYLAVLSLFDPPRHDTKSTIAAAIDSGIEVKMVTGDHTAIAKETCRELGMGTNIFNTDILNQIKTDPKDNVDKQLLAAIDRIILEAHGFAEVMPEHKFMIVERLRQQGHVTGMTGDGVNDAPALKRADIGIAVEGATDAARAAADLVLTEPGLSVIIDAIFESRKIFQRMRNYIIYRIACTIQLLCFFFFAALTVLPDSDFMYGKNFDGDAAHASDFTLPVISLVIITILNDGCMITISYDNVVAEKFPQKWAMGEMVLVSVLLGFVACVSSLLLLAYCMHANTLHRGDFMGIVFGSSGRDYVLWYELRTIIYLKVSVSDFLTLFAARTRTWFWERPVGRALGIAALVATVTSTLFSLFWDGIFEGLPGAYMGGLRYSKGAAVATWIYCLLWFLAQDALKVLTYWLYDTYLKSDSDKMQEAFARRHSLELEEGGSAPPEPHKGSVGRIAGGSVGKKHAPTPFLPSGIDLNLIAEAAVAETVRAKAARQKREEEARRRAGADTLAALAAGKGAGTQLKPEPAAAPAAAPAPAPAPAPAAAASAPSSPRDSKPVADSKEVQVNVA